MGGLKFLSAGDPLADVDRLRHIAGVIKEGRLIHRGNSR